MDRTPAELNQMSEEDLRAHVDGVLLTLREQNAPPVPKVATFITADVLLRIHNLVVSARSKDSNSSGGWSKQSTLAHVVGIFTGVKLARSDAEYIGNAQDYFLRGYVKQLRKAEQAQIRAARRAIQAGRQAQPSDAAMNRVSQLKLQIYRCKFGGVPRNVVATSGEDPIHKQAVPVRAVYDAHERNLQLLQEIIKLKEFSSSPAQRELNHNLNQLCTAVEQERARREQAEEAASDAAAQHSLAAAQVAANVQAFKRRACDAEKELELANRRLSCLGSQVAAAQFEHWRAAEREKKARTEAEQAIADAERAQTSAEARVREKLQTLRKRVREAEKERECAEGRALKLGRQVSAAQLEQAQALEREEQVRQAAQKVAEDAAQAQADAVAKVLDSLATMKNHMRATRKESDDMRGQLERLGSQLGNALVEAGRATECARGLKTANEVLKQRLNEQECEFEEKMTHLRALKAKMAKRARDADKRAGTADSLRKELSNTRKRLAEVRKEVNCTRVQLSLELREMSDGSPSESEEEQDVLPVGDGIFEEKMMESELAESEASALTLLRSMPTWRPVRGKGCGRGRPKMEWGTRVVIYSLLAMMVPPSAIGNAIVAIVRRTAPWLKPAAPTYETVKRCRFELRLLEEVQCFP